VQGIIATILDQEIKHVTGLAENGDNMKLFEVAEQKDQFEDVDLPEDLKFFMNNDSSFYRKVLYPSILAMKEKVKTGKPCDQMHFKPCISQGINSYCKKFKIEKNPKDLFSDEEIKDLAEKMFHQEKENIEKGVYDRKDK
jgi:hypothetical protein